MLVWITYQFFRLVLVTSVKVTNWVTRTIDRWANMSESPRKNIVACNMQPVLETWLDRATCGYCQWTVAPGDVHEYCNEELAIRRGEKIRCMYCREITEPCEDLTCPECRAAWKAYEDSQKSTGEGFCDVCGASAWKKTDGCPACAKRWEELQSEAWAQVDAVLDKEEAAEARE